MTNDSALWDTSPNRSPIRFCCIYNKSMLSAAPKRIYPFQCLPIHAIAKQLELKTSWDGVSNASSNFNRIASTCPPVSKILAQSLFQARGNNKTRQYIFWIGKKYNIYHKFLGALGPKLYHKLLRAFKPKYKLLGAFGPKFYHKLLGALGPKLHHKLLWAFGPKFHHKFLGAFGPKLQHKLLGVTS